MKKRGISPLIATVLIIGFVIILSSMVMIWGGDIFEKYKSESETKALTQLACTTKVSLNIKEACDLGTSVRVKVESFADQKIDSLLYRILSPSDGVVDIIKDNTYNKIGLSPFESKIFYLNYHGLGGMYTKPTKIEILPRILLDGMEQTCSGVSKEIKPCYTLPSLESLEGWTFEDETATGFLKDYNDLFKDKKGIYASGSNPIIISPEFVIPSGVDTLDVFAYSDDRITITLYINGVDKYTETLLPIVSGDGGGMELHIPADGEYTSDDYKQTTYLQITTDGGFVAIANLGYLIF